MKIKKVSVCFLWFLALIPAAFAGKTELTTYYPSAYGEYQNLTATDSVGIGTTSPTAKLHIQSGTGASTFSDIKIGGLGGWSNNEEHTISAVHSGGNVGSIIFHYDTTNKGAIRFGNIYNTAESTAISMTILGNGNVGIGSTAPTTKLDVVGGIKSTMWKTTQVYDMQASTLPLTSAAFTTGGGTLLVFASGTGYRAAAGQMGMSIAVDGVIKGYAKVYVNEASSHKTFAANALVVSGIASGSHTITLASWNSTLTDANDFFSVTVLELPF